VIILSPEEGSSIPAGQEFDIVVKVQNLEAGSFVST
jgi:hypothetical protein